MVPHRAASKRCRAGALDVCREELPSTGRSSHPRFLVGLVLSAGLLALVAAVGSGAADGAVTRPPRRVPQRALRPAGSGPAGACGSRPPAGAPVSEADRVPERWRAVLTRPTWLKAGGVLPSCRPATASY